MSFSTTPNERPFRFGVTSPGTGPAKQWRDLAHRVEELGYSSLFVPDHFRDQLSPMVALMAAAQATEQLRVGTLVLANDFRHPAVLAKEAATVDLLSDGRLELGIGAGWAREDYDRVGLPFERAGARVDRLFESVAILKALLSGESVDFQGEHYSVRGLEGRPIAAQRPHPPLIIGGGGPRILRFAAREADIVGINIDLRSGQSMNPKVEQFGPAAVHTALASAVEERVDLVRREAGDRFGALELNVRVFVAEVTEERQRVADEYSQSFQISADELLGVPHVLIGTPAQMAEDLLERRERFGITYYVVPHGVMNDFAPVVQQLTGR